MKDKQIWASDVAFERGVSAFQARGKYLIYGLGGSQKVFIYSEAMRDLGQVPTVIIVHDKAHKEMWERDLQCLLPTVDVLSFPQVEEETFFSSAKSLDLQSRRALALGALTAQQSVVVIATPEEVAQPVVAKERLIQHILRISIGDVIDREDVLTKLVQMGYERVGQVEQCGHFSVRGDIVDIYPINGLTPYRVEFFGDDIDTIRTFDVDTQRSIEECQECVIMPFHLEGEPKEETLLSYIEKGICIWDEPRRIEDQLKAFMREDATHKDSHFDWKALQGSNRAKTEVNFMLLQGRMPGISGDQIIGIMGKTMISYERQIPILVDEVKQWLHMNRQVVLVMQNLQRRQAMEGALRDGGITYVHSPDLIRTEGVVLFYEGLLTEGFELPHSQLVVITEGNIFGYQKKRIRKKADQGQKIQSFADISQGDYVVHSVHGIGRYTGIRTIESNGIHRDYLEIVYAGTDKLFLSAEHLDQLQKYIGNEGTVPKLHKMGGREWGKAKLKAQQSIEALAEKLINIYAARERVEGFAFLPDQPWQQEFEEAFPYEETEDQLQAIQEIKASMEKPRPMDRLLCGDVGFGKTEVAMRAMFKAVMSGKQVAMLVPTTVLSEQHYKTFIHRFDAFGIRVEVLNRFRTTKEKKHIMEGIKDGSVDILIGTHSLLSKKVEFRQLGLLVVDEEQRFGVAQKEKWKEWANRIDILTLSATPIPRTLHMSLVGVREMSVIHTPPMERLPVQTYVVEYDMAIIVEAIQKELQRGGQVFFVYNRVQSIEHMKHLLEEALPNLRIAIAHGQMTGTMMETIMQDFTEGAYDVLLCTSIIETGIDIPNANTMIVYDADHMGLSQLYQMRGRVGRSRNRAYAYFLYRPDKILNEAAEKRLKAIQEFTELGAGFKLAMRDLEIRGAGNLLGPQQHGNIAAVGFAMYATMLEEALEKLHQEDGKQKESAPKPMPITIDLGVDAFFDDAYIGDSSRKISLYQKLLAIGTMQELEEFVEELIDRFGNPTEPVERLIRLAYIKERARALGVKSVVRKDHTLVFTWGDESKMADWDLASVKEEYWKRMKNTCVSPVIWTCAMTAMGILPDCENLLTEFERRIDNEAE